MAYTTLKLPTDLAEQIDMAIKVLRVGYRSRTDIASKSVRRRLEEVAIQQQSRTGSTKGRKLKRTAKG